MQSKRKIAVDAEGDETARIFLESPVEGREPSINFIFFQLWFASQGNIVAVCTDVKLKIMWLIPLARFATGIYRT